MKIHSLKLIAICAVLGACGQPVTSPESAVENAVDTAAINDTSQNTNEFALQLERSAGIRAVKRLQHAYALYVSAGEWDQAAALFSSNGTAQFGEEVVAASDIARWLERNYGSDGDRNGWLGEQLIFSPVINISPDALRAEGRWRLVAMFGDFGNSAQWLGGTFENAYVRNGKVWQIESLRLYPVYGGDYENGWRMLKEETPEDVAPIPYHFTVTQSGQPQLPATAQVGNTADRSDADIALPAEAQLAAIDAQAAHLIDEDDIVSLQNAWGYYMDRHMWDDAAELFSSEATLDLPATGVVSGTDAILAAFESLGAQPLPNNIVDERMQLHTIVEVAADGLSATARGTELRLFGEHASDTFWGLNAFRNSYVKLDGVWHIDNVQVTPRMHATYDEGWAQASAAQPGSWPEFSVPAFAFAHPVTDARSQNAVTTIARSNPVTPEDIARRLRVLNAYEGAENVSNAYGYYIDEFLWDPMADVFSIDGWKELSYIGAYVGRERVRDSVVSRYGRGGRRPNSMTFHQKTQPVISVAEDGRSAAIRTRLFQLNASTANPGSYISGIYENRIVNEDGVWKISAMDLDYAWLANYVGGWAGVDPAANSRFAPAPGSLQGEQAPDRPLRGVTFAPYPAEPLDMAFHYVNPVSGRRPPIYLPEEY